MVYLVRTMRFLKYDENMDKETQNLFEHMKKTYPQIKDLKVLFNITGPINEFHCVMHFDSLADEDEWASQIVKDEVYLNWFQKADGIFTPGVDRLYRDAPQM
jgi:hypothetical protein